MSEPKNGVWLGLRRCGCPVAVVVDNGDHPKDVNQSKREFLKEGLQVIAATWSEWETVYRPKFLKDCEHERTIREAHELPLLAAAVDPIGDSEGTPTTRV